MTTLRLAVPVAEPAADRDDRLRFPGLAPWFERLDDLLFGCSTAALLVAPLALAVALVTA